MRIKFLLCAVVLFAILGAAEAKTKGSLIKSGEPYYEYVHGDVLVKFTDQTKGANAAAVISQIGGTVAYYDVLLDFYRVTLAATMTERDAVTFFRARSDVEWANFNYIAHALFTPNDPLYVYQWHYPRINLPDAWDITRGTASVVVAVCDQGFYFDHADWGGVLTANPWDFIDNDNNPAVTHYDSHGAHVAGTIFAATNNNSGVAGIAPLCTLMPVRVLDDEGSGSAAQISSGIAWAANNGADVINLSLGFPVSGPPDDPGPPLSTAITAAANAGSVICAATGNDGQPYVGYPAAYDVCIAVGSTAYDDAIAPYSNYGDAIDVTAPGGNTDQDLNQDGFVDGVLSTLRNDQGDYFAFWQGTSMATPHVAGVAALLLSHDIAPENVRAALQETAVDLGGPGWDNVFGHGRINALAALNWQGGGGGETVLFNEPFENFPLQGWQAFEYGVNGIGWQSLAGSSSANCGTAPHGGSNAVWHDDEDLGGEQDDRLRTPEIPIPVGATNVIFSFWQRNCYVPNYYNYHGVWYSTNGTDFSTLGELDEDQQEWEYISVDATGLAGGSVWFEWRYVGDYETEWFLDDVRVTAENVSAVNPEKPALPSTMALGEPYPNPFNSIATIPLQLSNSANVEMAVYNTLGQRVATLLDHSRLTAGSHTIQWNASTVGTGVYFVTLKTADVVQTKKLLLVK